MNKLTTSEKIRLMIKLLKDYKGLFILEMVFILIGGTLIFAGLRSDIIVLIVTGGILIAFPLFFIVYTMPSTVAYYYERALIKKYGKTTSAHLIKKEVKNNSYYERNSRNEEYELISEFDYLLTFSFEYQKKTFENSAFVEKNQFEKLNTGDLIPIKFLSIAPTKSSIRKIKLKKMTN